MILVFDSMGKIALIDGNFVKNADQPVKSCYVNGELQKRFEEFSKKFKVTRVQPFADRMLLVEYED